MIKKVLLMGLCAALLASTTLAFAGDVFVTKSGTKYHKEDCRLIKNRETTKMDEQEAIEEGYTPCGRCFKEKAKEAKASDKSTKKSIAKKKK